MICPDLKQTERYVDLARQGAAVQPNDGITLLISVIGNMGTIDDTSAQTERTKLNLPLKAVQAMMLLDLAPLSVLGLRMSLTARVI